MSRRSLVILAGLVAFLGAASLVTWAWTGDAQLAFNLLFFSGLYLPVLVFVVLLVGGPMRPWRTRRLRSRELVRQRLAQRPVVAQPEPRDARPPDETLDRTPRRVSLRAVAWTALAWTVLWLGAFAWAGVAIGYGYGAALGGGGRGLTFGAILVVFSWLPIAFLLFRHRTNRRHESLRRASARARLAARLGRSSG